jgi:hypothetical protein
MPTSALRERRVLTISLVATLLSATGSIVAGLWIGSKSILFDGVYEVVDAGMTALAIVTAGLIARGEDRRFQYGYWHLEPMLATGRTACWAGGVRSGSVPARSSPWSVGCGALPCGSSCAGSRAISIRSW